MTILMLAFAVLLPTSVGFLLVAYLSPSNDRQAFPERLFLGYGIGMGIITCELFVLGLLGLKLRLILVSGIQIAIIIFLCYMVVRSGIPFGRIIGFKRGTISPLPGGGVGFRGEKRSKAAFAFILFLSGWILLKMIFVICESANWPIAEWDSWTAWSSLAKFFFYEQGLALDPSNENFLGRGYRESLMSYPLHVPLLQVWFSLCLGEANEMYMKMGNVFYFLSMIGLLYVSLTRETSWRIALLAAFFLSSVPLLTYHAITAYAEIPLSYYSLAAMTSFWKYTATREEAPANGRNGLLILTGLCIVLSMWTKIEGIFFLVAFMSALSLYLLLKERSLKKFIIFFIPVMVVMTAWFMFLAVSNIEVSYLREKILAGFHWEVLPVIVNQSLFSANFNIIFVFFFAMFFLGLKLIFRSDLKYLYIALFSVMASFLFIYLTTDFYKWVLNLTVVNRNILTFIPIMYYVATLTAIKVLGSER